MKPSNPLNHTVSFPPHHSVSYNPSWSLPKHLRLTQQTHPTEINLLDFHRGEVKESFNLSPDDCRASVESPSICWFDITGLGNLELLEQIREIFAIDAYLLEDLINVPHRPKVEEFSGLLSIITQMAIIRLSKCLESK